MRLGAVVLPTRRWARARETWQRVEQLGFDTAWTYDHLSWRSLRDGPWFGAVTTLTAAAAVTSTVRLGTLVASANFRHPVPFAKDVMGLDDVSEGRFRLGLGAGGTGFDATVLGGDPWPARERTERFEDFVDLLDQLLRSPHTTASTRHYAAHEARMLPGCVQRPRVPFAVAASGPRGLRLAARHASTWVTYGVAGGGPAAVAAQGAALEDACAAVGRDPGELGRLLLTGLDDATWLASPGAFADLAGAYAEAGVDELALHWPLDPADEPAFERAVLEGAAQL